MGNRYNDPGEGDDRADYEAEFNQDNDDEYFEDEFDPEERDDDFDNEIEFADPGGNSALRAASASNPRNLPCPTCRAPNRLTPADKARGYQCDSCADRAERGGDY